MVTVHRYGIPPKKLSHKLVVSIPDFHFSEERFVDWAKTNCTGNVQYDFILFPNSDRVHGREYELMVWFLIKRDAELFRQQWMQ